MWSCELSLEVIEKDGEASLSRWIELPFVPFEGLQLIITDEEVENGFGFFVRSVAWTRDGVFWVDMGREFFAGSGCLCTETDEIPCCRLNVEKWRSDGWTVDSERRGKDRFYTFDGMWGERPENGFAIDAKGRIIPTK